MTVQARYKKVFQFKQMHFNRSTNGSSTKCTSTKFYTSQTHQLIIMNVWCINVSINISVSFMWEFSRILGMKPHSYALSILWFLYLFALYIDDVFQVCVCCICFAISGSIHIELNTWSWSDQSLCKVISTLCYYNYLPFGGICKHTYLVIVSGVSVVVEYSFIKQFFIR